LLFQRGVIAAASLEAQRAKTAQAAAKATAAVEARRTLAVESYGWLLEALSPEGRKKLVAHIEVVKSQMKAFDFPR
jgi:hypothetical protein